MERNAGSIVHNERLGKKPVGENESGSCGDALINAEKDSARPAPLPKRVQLRLHTFEATEPCPGDHGRESVVPLRIESCSQALPGGQLALVRLSYETGSCHPRVPTLSSSTPSKCSGPPGPSRGSPRGSGGGPRRRAS